MTIKIVITEDMFNEAWECLKNNPKTEQAVFLLAGLSSTDKNLSLVVREVLPVPDEHYLSRSATFLKITPEFINQVLKIAEYEGLEVIMAHIHPLSINTQAFFSSTDDMGEKDIIHSLSERAPDRIFAAMVFHSPDNFAARIYLQNNKEPQSIQELRIIGRHLKNLVPANTPRELKQKNVVSERYDRQIIALGVEGQRQIEKTTVGIVGAGGTGSHVIQQLAHLGVKSLIIADPDELEVSNISRVVGCGHNDVGSHKVKIAEREVKRIQPLADINAIPKGIECLETIKNFRDADLIFCCTDNLISRAIVNHFCHQYLIPLIDMGVSLKADKGKLVYGNGDVRVTLPGEPCLYCTGIIDPVRISQELEGSIAENPYIDGLQEEPSVISFNGVVASLAVTEFLAIVTGFTKYTSGCYLTHLILEGGFGTPSIPQKDSQCPVCSKNLGYGDDFSRLPCS